MTLATVLATLVLMVNVVGPLIHRFLTPDQKLGTVLVSLSTFAVYRLIAMMEERASALLRTQIERALGPFVGRRLTRTMHILRSDNVQTPTPEPEPRRAAAGGR